MTETTKLDAERHEAIYTKKIADYYLPKSKAQTHPCAVITGGQPGSGKSGITANAIERFRETGYVLVDADKLRPKHPEYERLMKENDRLAANLTHADCGPWATRLMRDAVQGRRNLIIDQTSRDPEALAKITQGLKQAGYTVELHVMAVPAAVSEQRIHLRYEGQRARNGFGRFSTKDKHDEAYAGVANSVAAAEDSKLVDRLCIYDQKVQPIYENRLEGGQWQREARARKTLEDERARPMTLQERLEYAKGFDDLAELLARPERQATPEEIRRVDELRRAAKTALVSSQLAPIQRRTFEQADRQAVQDAVIEAVERDPEQFLRAYVADERSYGGRYVCADLFKEQFPQFAASKEARNRYNTPVHNAAAVLAAEQFRRKVADDSEPQRDKVIFLTGIPGAGKTSSVLQGRRFPDDYRVIFEGQLSRPASSIPKIQQALDAGLKPRIIAVHVLPENALQNTLQRFHEHGRGASINVMAEIQGNLPDGLLEIHERFGEQVALSIADYRNRALPRVFEGWENLNTLRSEGNHEYIKQRLETALEQQRVRISEPAWRQARGLAPDERVYGANVDAGYVGELQTHEQRRGIPQGSSQAPVLTAAAPDETIVEAAEAVQSEQQAMLTGASLQQTYEATLANYVEAKHNQVARLEGRLKNLIEQQDARVRQLENSAPGKFSLPGTKRAWQVKVAHEQARQRTLRNRLEAVREIREGTGLRTPRINELATRRMRAENPELASSWDAMREAQRKQEEEERKQWAEERIREKEERRQEQNHSRGRTLRPPR